jgi:hypothetical protein
MGQADAQSQPAITGSLGGEGVLCHAQRMIRIGWDNGRAELNAACVLADDREGRQCVVAEHQQVRDPEVTETVRLGLFHLLRQSFQVVYLTSCTRKYSNTHVFILIVLIVFVIVAKRRRKGGAVTEK